MQARSSFSGYAGKLCCLFSRLEFETLWFISTPLGCLLEQTEVRPQSARRFICFSVFWIQLLPTANPGGSCKKGVRLTLPRPGVQIGVLVVGLLGYRHTVTQERDQERDPTIVAHRSSGGLTFRNVQTPGAEGATEAEPGHA